ncbi:hypothetical protein FEM41_15240 [Jejubacter calystegiae]|uniref:DUF4402 domain-containing protein n=1 Tax=Jejubacter calystegiae TaxID=2579935 RepID=A0A4P8YQC2_9ENTR|nr:hypothetical protein [Jejubacter calystegiae]QCT20902.1 hypothetical protein FEM41_15240 [Jejubacter calystegiae]
MMNKFLAALLCVSSSAWCAVTVKTNIDVEAKVETSVRVYVGNKDVTNGSIMLQLSEVGGYMEGTTPAFIFIGNASSVKLSLEPPANKSLLSENGDLMKLNTLWQRTDGGTAVTNFDLNNQKVYPDIGQVDDLNYGPKISFKSEKTVESYPLGTYKGTYILKVSPAT